MSELITRRTFLKATGAAALVAAAGSMLVGCGDGAYASTPENLVAPPIDNSDFANFGSFTADIGPLSGQWTSSSIYESDTRHNYFYTGFKLDNDSGPVTTSSFDKFYRGTITITLSKLNNQTATFTFNGLISDPSSTVS